MLNLPDVDVPLHEQLRAGLANFTSEGDPRKAILLNHAVKRYHHKVFILSLKDLAGSQGKVPVTTPAGSRVLARHASGAVSAHLTEAVAGARRIASLTDLPPQKNGGRDPDQLVKALEWLRQAKQVQGADYEVVALRIPALWIEAFWLRPKSGGAAHWIYPVSEDPRLPNEIYSLKDFLGEVRKLADARLKIDDNPRPPETAG
jgi:hypothetical protein